MDPGRMILMRSYSSIARSVRIVCGILGVVGSHPVASQTPSPPKTIFGVYGQPTAGQDSIQITRGVHEKIGVALKLYFSSGHSCQLKQAGEWRGEAVGGVAEIGIHHADDRCGRASETVHDGGAEAQLARSMDRHEARTNLSRQLVDDTAGAVGGIIVHDDQLTVEAGAFENREYGSHQLSDACALVVRGDDH
jgi:hypothetical protein